MITADQIAVHLFGDYCSQSDWMAQGKTKSWLPAACHAVVYSLPFWMFQPSLYAWLVIVGTHYLIDRYRLARYVAWAKNFLAPKTWWKLIRSEGWMWRPADNQFATAWRVWIDSSIGEVPEMFKDTVTIRECRNLPFKDCSLTGYPPSTPPWLSFWLLIILDNLIHIGINAAAIKYL